MKAIITGASSGIGRDMARILSKKGYELVLVARDEEKLNQVKQELKKEKSKVQISILCPGPVNTNFNNVANVKFHMREANSYDVAKYAIEKLEKGKFYIVPGLDVKLAKIGAKMAPTSLISKITYRIQKRKIER